MNIVVGPIPLTSPLKLQLPVLLRTGRLFSGWMDRWWCCGCCWPGCFFVLVMMMMMMRMRAMRMAMMLLMLLLLMMMLQLLMMVVMFFLGEGGRFQFCESQELIEVREDDCGNRVSCHSISSELSSYRQLRSALHPTSQWYLGISKNRGYSQIILILIGLLHEINHPFSTSPIFGNTHFWKSKGIPFILDFLWNFHDFHESPQLGEFISLDLGELVY